MALSGGCKRPACQEAGPERRAPWNDSPPPCEERAQVVEQTVADDDVVMIRGAANTRAVSVLLRGANDYLLDEMDRSLHDAFCIVKRVLESGVVVPGAPARPRPSLGCYILL
jgi:chaperonin GroEL (HSP60 family)